MGGGVETGKRTVGNERWSVGHRSPGPKAKWIVRMKVKEKNRYPGRRTYLSNMWKVHAFHGGTLTQGKKGRVQTYKRTGMGRCESTGTGSFIENWPIALRTKE